MITRFDELHYGPGQPFRFVRSIHMWRRPTAHILQSSGESYLDEELAALLGKRPGWREYYGPLCRASVLEAANIYETLPEGFHVCQRCAEVAAADARRDAQRADPNWAAYVQRTLDLLQEAA